MISPPPASRPPMPALSEMEREMLELLEALHRAIEQERRLQEQLRGVREYQADLLRRYSKAHGFCVPLSVDQFLKNEARAA